MHTTIHTATSEQLRIPPLTRRPRPQPARSAPSPPGTPGVGRGILRVGRRVAGALSSLALAAAIVVLLAIGVAPHIFGFRTVTMLSGSMSPLIRPGDVIIDTPEPLAAVKVGQIITFHTPTATGYVDSHRVIQVQHQKDGAVLIRTKGDANKSPDAWVAELHGRTAWRERFVIRHLGYLIHLLRGPAIHVLLLWIVPALLVGWALVTIWRRPASSEAAAS
jgi:signal peptidase I